MSERGIIYDIRRKLQVLAYDITSPEFVSKVYFKHLLGYSLNLNNPQTFNEKIQWLKLYEWPNNERTIQCADKYRIRDYLIEKGMEDYLNILIGVWDNPDLIDWKSLPNRFVMKVNSGSAYNIICNDKSCLDIDQSVKKLKRWMKEDFGKFNAEPHYSKIKPRVICERFLDGASVNYKFFCFNGKAKVFDIDQNNNAETFFDENGELMNFCRSDFPTDPEVTIPTEFDTLKCLSEHLSEGFPFVRMDWYIDNHHPYISEMTFTPCGGLIPFSPKEFDNTLGSFLNIDKLISKSNGNA